MTTKTPEERLKALGLTLPAVPTPMANYVPYRVAGHLLYLSGQGPKRPDGSFVVGRLGKDATASLEVAWPSGTTQKFANVAANRLLTIDEARGLITR